MKLKEKKRKKELWTAKKKYRGCNDFLSTLFWIYNT